MKLLKTKKEPVFTGSFGIAVQGVLLSLSIHQFLNLLYFNGYVGH